MSLLVKRVTDDFQPSCPDCGSADIHRLISSFAFHLSMRSKLEQLDPKYDKMIDASNPDLAFENLVKRYNLDRPLTKRNE